MFPLAYQPGEIGFCDFTRVKRVAITLRGEPFPHLLFHYRLAWSGWAYGQIVHGGESFVALSEGLQNALAACGGVPKQLRTDRLSAASRNRDGSYALDITSRYQALCAHYGLSPSRNNRGVAHENGIVEAPHGHVKRRLEQKLILRGSCDFEEAAEYGELLAEVFSALNTPRQRRYEQELEHLGSLPAFRFADYELLTVRVRRTSTIEVRPGGAQAPPRRGGEPLAHGAQREFVASLARAAVAFGVVGGANKVLLDRLEPLLEQLMAAAHGPSHSHGGRPGTQWPLRGRTLRLRGSGPLQPQAVRPQAAAGGSAAPVARRADP
jgi:hypothetical protein